MPAGRTVVVTGATDGPLRAYSRSKLAQVMFTLELAGRLPPGVAAAALHPASLMDTKMVRVTFGRPWTSMDEGANALLWLLEADGVHGRYFDGTRGARAHPQAYDAGARERLWELSAKLTGAGPRA